MAYADIKVCIRSKFNDRGVKCCKRTISIYFVCSLVVNVAVIDTIGFIHLIYQGALSRFFFYFLRNEGTALISRETVTSYETAWFTISQSKLTVNFKPCAIRRSLCFNSFTRIDRMLLRSHVKVDLFSLGAFKYIICIAFHTLSKQTGL